MPWYRPGSVAITAGQTTVTGTGTDFAANSRVGDAFLGPDGRWYEVANIASATVLSILPAYQGETLSAGAYAIAPMQGYVKESADALRTIVNQYGEKIAALGSTGNYDILPVEKGGTGGSSASAARLGLGLGTAAVASIVGSVSSGAILEYSSNANGRYLKLADGTLICWATGGVYTASSSLGGLYFNSGAVMQFPHAFYDVPAIVPLGSNAGSASLPIPYKHSESASSVAIGAYEPLQGASFSAGYVAIGRWKQ